MYKKLIILLLLALVVGIPFIFKKREGEVSKGGDETLVILTAHNEALRHEFTLGFKDWYYTQTGKTVNIDWRSPGAGTQELLQYVDSIYANAFRLYWENVLGREWNAQVQEAFVNRMNVGKNSVPGLFKEVKEAFDGSNVGSGIDLFFGGGKVDVINQGKKGQIVPLGIFERHPEWFRDESIPHYFSGNELWDEGHRWVGTAISGFGIISNRDVLRKIGVNQEIKQWEDLTSDKLVGEVAVTDPIGSGTFTMTFEIIIQQQMQKELRRMLEGGEVDNEETEKKAVSRGWMKGMQIIQLISANARYFTDAATKPVLDVSAGDCGVGLSIDFYGLFQEENLRLRSGSDRFVFVMPEAGSAVSPDPIAMFKGAPHPELALDFIEYILSIDGQKLWDFKVGAPGGPKLYALSRPPIRKELYEPEYLQYRQNPNMNLYKDAGDFMYHPQWTGGLFKELRFVIKAAFVDPHEDLVSAWKAIIEARKRGDVRSAERALGVMQNLENISYEAVSGPIKKTLYSGDPLDTVQLEAKITRQFRQRYKQARKIAQGESMF